MTAPTTLPDPAICADRWPARVTLEHTQPVRARVILTVADRHRPPQLWVWTPEHHLDGRPHLLIHEQWAPAESTVPITGEGTWNVATSTGVYVVESAGGCGRCGSALGRWQPWTPMRHTRMPADLRRRLL